MGNDYRTEPVEPSWMIREHAHDHEGGRRHLPPHAYEQPRPPAHPSAEDAASVMGLPAETVTPELLAALTPVLAEIDRLHWEAGQTRHRIAWLEHQADRHSVVPCLSRRAVLREIDHYLTGQGAPSGTLAVIQVCGFEDLRSRHGLPAGEEALRHVGATILGALRAADLVGCLGFSDFAVLLPGTPEAEAGAKLAEICVRIAEPELTWGGESVRLQPSFGLYALQAGDDAERALAAADRARRVSERSEGLAR